MEKLLELKNVNLNYIGGYTGLVDISLVLEKGKGLVVTGFSNSGKSNLARTIAGLERASSGEIIYKGVPITSIPLKERNISLLFNDSSLFDNKSIYENIAYPMQLREYKEETIKEKIDNLASMLNIDKYLNENIKKVSDKVKSLVLLARMFGVERDLYLIDEPFKNFSNEEKKKLYPILKDLLKGKSYIYFTRSLEEGLEFQDKCLVIDHFKLVDEIDYYSQPNHIASSLLQGASEVYATLRKIGEEYCLDILEEDIIDEDRERFIKDTNYMVCRPPISDIYIDKKILAVRNSDNQIDIYNYFDLASMYNIAKINKE